jgi:tetratricopeptide (TPR) repeat protein
MDLTIVFSTDRMSPAKREAIEIAQRHESENKNGMFKVKFDKRSNDLNQLIELCSSWKLTQFLIKNKKYSESEVCEVLYCEDRRGCHGRCEHGHSPYDFLLDQIEKCIDDPYDDDIQSEWLTETVSNSKSFEQLPDGTFKINKDALKREVENNFFVPLNICEKIDLNKFYKQIDSFTDTLSIPAMDEDRAEDSSVLDDEERDEAIEKAELMAPIFAKAIRNEFERVIIANFGNEKTASDFIRKADALCSLERYEESLECYDRALGLYPTNPLLWNGKASLLEYFIVDYENAAVAYTKAFELDSDNIEALHRKGICFDSLGKEREAVAEYEKAIELFKKWLKECPNDKDAKENLYYTKENLSAIKNDDSGETEKSS